MNKKDVREGVVVYHSIFTSWGKGVVRKITSSIFDPRKKFYYIDFECRDEPVRIDNIRCLRKTPNRAKIKAMVQFYILRGTNAVDGGDKLVLPDQEKGKAHG